MTIKIDKGIPIPPRLNNGGRPAAYPFSEMQVGDSFVYSGNSKAAISTTSAASRRLGFKFTTRVEGDGLVRIWRIA